jgi:hypothetical protein
VCRIITTEKISAENRGGNLTLSGSLVADRLTRFTRWDLLKGSERDLGKDYEFLRPHFRTFPFLSPSVRSLVFNVEGACPRSTLSSPQMLLKDGILRLNYKPLPGTFHRAPVVEPHQMQLTTGIPTYDANISSCGHRMGREIAPILQPYLHFFSIGRLKIMGV